MFVSAGRYLALFETLLVLGCFIAIACCKVTELLLGDMTDYQYVYNVSYLHSL